MKRRNFLALTAAGMAAGLVAPPRKANAAVVFDPKPGPWRGYAISTAVNVQIPPGTAPGPVQVWVPLPSLTSADWITPEGDDWTGTATRAEVVTEPESGARILHATFAEGVPSRELNVVSRFRTRDRGDVLQGTGATPLSAAERELFTRGTELLPIDGIVKETADRITAGKSGDEAKARAIYDWVVENTHRVAEVRGCGLGDVASMLASGNLGGKCADLNALYVALARASGLPARDLYGIRVAPSQFGYKSLGAGSEVITKAQHCRAEVWLNNRGWVPVDPADVRKVVLEEPPGKNALDSEVVTAARAKLFGAWEGNWLAYNDAHDVLLPGSTHKVSFLMYPQAEVAGALLDCLSPDTFAYKITSAPLPA